MSEGLLHPTLELSSNPTITLAEIRARRFFILDRASILNKYEAATKWSRLRFIDLEGAEELE